MKARGDRFQLPKYFNLVAEPRLLLLLITVATLMTMLLVFDFQPQMTLTMFSAILAKSTTTSAGSVDADGASTTESGAALQSSADEPSKMLDMYVTAAPAGVQFDADSKRLTTSIRAILATSTTTAVDEQRMVAVLQRALTKSRMRAEDAIQRLEQLQASMQGNLGPTELVYHLRKVGILENDDDLDETSFLEQGFSDDVFKPNATPLQHDPWWFESDMDDQFSVSGRTEHHNNSAVLQSVHVKLTEQQKHADVGQLTSMLVHGRRLAGELKSMSWVKRHRLHLVMVLIGTTVIISAISAMNPGQRFNQGGRAGYTADVGAATLKTPPAWSLEGSGSYSLRSWLSDVVLWAGATDLEPERQGPAVALVVTGAARDLVRELAPQELRDGIWEQGVHVPGLMLLCRTLARHYAPHETEVQTRAMAEMMGFARLPNESIDGSLARFEVLRHRAVARGGFAMGAPSLAYLLLNGLRLRSEQWERVLLPLDGQLPMTEQQFNQLLDRLRRVGRMAEGQFQPPHRQGATGDVGSYHFFPTFDQPHPIPGTGFGPDYEAYYRSPGAWGSDNAAAAAFQNPVTPDMPMPSGMNQSFAAVPIADDEEQCPRCGMYYMDDEFSSCTDTDNGETDNEASVLYGNLSENDAKLGNELYEAYMVAKRRWRRFSNKPPRRYRRNHFNKFRHQSNVQKFKRFGSSYAAFLPPNAFAAHRGPGGKSGGKGKGKRSNPRGRDGQPLKCFKCGSTEHLARHCTKPDASANMSMLVAPTNPVGLQFFTKGFASEHPSEVGLGSSASSVASSSKRSWKDDIESLRSFSAVNKRKVELVGDSDDDAERFAENVPRCPPPTEVAPTAEELQVQSHVLPQGSQWMSFTTGSLNNISGVVAATHDDQTERLLSGLQSLGSARAKAIKDQPTQGDQLSRSPRRKKQVSEQHKEVRAATTLQLSQLLNNMSNSSAAASDAESASSFPWWETANRDEGRDGVPSYHTMRTRTPDGRIGLLVDPGAHDNLAGENTLRNLELQLGVRGRARELSAPLHVSGVGRLAQTAETAVTVDFDLPTPEIGIEQGTSSSFTTPILPGSDLPLLLGLKSLQSKRAILDTHGRLLILPGAGGIEFRVSPGSMVLQLEQSSSGHLILPMRPPSQTIDPRTMRSDRERLNERRLNFNVQCRETRTPSPVRTPVHVTDSRQRLIEREDGRGQTWVIGRSADAVAPTVPRVPAFSSVRSTTSVRPAPTEPAGTTSAARTEGAASAPSSSEPRNVSRTPRTRESNSGPSDAAGPEA